MTLNRWSLEYKMKTRARKIILIRHGQSEGNVDKSVYSRKPDPLVQLTPKGHEQAADAGRRLKRLLEKQFEGEARERSVSSTAIADSPVKVIWFFYSPYRRTIETLCNVVQAFGSSREGGEKFRWRVLCTESPRLREQDFGNLQHLKKMKERREEREFYGRYYYRFPDGESGADAYDRVTTLHDNMLD